MINNITILMFYLSAINLYAQYDDPYQYYPITMGNYWSYSTGPSPSSPYSWKVYADSTDSVGNKYCWMSPRYVGDRPSFCIDTNYYFINRPTWGIDAEYLYKLDVEVGENWWVWQGDTSDTNIGTWCEVGSIYDGTYLDVETRFKVFVFYNRVKDNNEYYDYMDHIERLAYGIGLVYRDNDAYYPNELIGAIINGEIIGNPVSIEENPYVELPVNFELYQNYPNPFNPSTVIKFALPVTSNVTLTIYNMMGEEIKTLSTNNLSEGVQQFTWNGTNKNNELVSSGIYIYRIQANGNNGRRFLKMAKMMMLK